MEFLSMVMIASIALFVTLAVFSDMLDDGIKEKTKTVMVDYAYSLQNEFIMANHAQKGYQRVIEIPEKIEGFSVSVYNTNTVIMLNYSGGVYGLPIPYTFGSLALGSNTLRNFNGSVCINC